MTLTMSDIKEVFFNTATGQTQDAVHPITGNGLWSGLSQQELEERDEATIERLPIDEAVERQQQADRIRYCKAPKPVSAERAQEMLEVLPPYRWQHCGNVEMFAVGEALCGSLMTWFVRIGSQWFEINEERSIEPHQLVELCQAIA